MSGAVNYLHALALIEAFAFLYLVEQRSSLSPRGLGIGHFCFATGLIAGAFATTATSSAAHAFGGLELGFVAFFVAAFGFFALAVGPLFIATRLRGRAERLATG